MGLLGNLFDEPHEGSGFKGKFRRIYEIAKPSLNLSAEQQQEIAEIFKEFKEERADIKAQPTLSRHDEIKNARKDAKEKVLAVLTPEQRQIFENNIDKWRKQVD